MTRSAVEETTASRRRFLITWLLLVGLTLAAFAGTVAVLNSTLYSASGFVGSYLNTLARHDVSAALATPGVTPPTSGADDLLVPAALRPARATSAWRATRWAPTAPTASSTATRSRGSGRCLSSWWPGRGVHLGFFSSWRFQVSPMGILTVTPQHAASFTANGIPLTAAKPGAPAAYRVLTPGLGRARAFVDATSPQSRPRSR